MLESRYVESFPLTSPQELLQDLPISSTQQQNILQSRKELEAIIEGKDARLICIVGPCSIHDPQSALEYAAKLKQLSDKIQDKIYLVMRVYFEKPRTTVGWRGFINDPFLDGSHRINEGLKKARQLLLDMSDIGVPTATEFVDDITHHYISDLISWAAIGARTVESQQHRMMASGLPMPVGFKNTVSGDVVAAVNATIVAARPNQFIGTNEQGKTSIVKTSGNPHCHIILRGSSNKTNYDIFSMKQAQHLLLERGLAQKILIDCSHGNASQSHSNQVEVINSLMNVVKNKQGPILGFMLESHLFEGRQDILRHGLPSILRYGQSLTDACLGWNETESTLLRVFNEA